MSNLSGFDRVSLNPPVEDEEEKEFKDYVKELLTPWDPEEFNEGGIIDKALSIFVSPIFFACKITCPVVGENEKETWNRPLMVLQATAIPWAYYLLLKQYGAEPFGEMPRWSVAMCVSAGLGIRM